MDGKYANNRPRGCIPLKINVLGIHFDDLTVAEAVEIGSRFLDSDCFHYAVTPNPEFILSAEKDGAFRSIINRADLVLADGIGVIHSARLLGTPLKGRVTGVDFAANMLAELDQRGGRLFLLGAKPGVAETAGENISRQYPNLTVCGTHDGYFKQDEPVVQTIREAKPDLLFVCLGAPKQEKWMAAHGADTGAKLAIGLGGVLDVYAGTVQRAPKAFQKLGMEWAYRLYKEPKRFGRMVRLPLVLIKAVKLRLSGGTKKEDA